VANAAFVGACEPDACAVRQRQRVASLKVVYGLVGNCAGVEFMEFLKINETFDDVLEMMTNQKELCY
jgi:hypothetical protein